MADESASDAFECAIKAMLADSGLDAEDQEQLLQDLEKHLELRIGTTLSEGFTEAELDEFEEADDHGKVVWLAAHRPDYRDVVEQARREVLDQLRVKLEKMDKAGAPVVVPTARAQRAESIPWRPPTREPVQSGVARPPSPEENSGPDDGVREFRMRLLYKRGNAGEAARYVAFRLATIVAESPPDAWLTWDTYAVTAGGELTSVIRCHQSIDAEVLDWVFDHVAEWEQIASPSHRPGRYVSEVLPSALLTPPERPGLGFLPGAVADPNPIQSWPGPTRVGDELLRALGDEGDICLRVQIAPATEAEADELAEDLVESWPTLRSDEAVSYAAAPVRMRVFLSTPAAYVPARVRAIMRAGRRELALVTIGERTRSDVVDLWERQVPDQVLPGLAAQVLMFAPAASREPLIGLLTADPPPDEHPLMEELEPTQAPVRLGTARSVRGEMTDATVDADDLLKHLQVLGQTGTGKSTLLAALVRQMAGLGCGLVVLDPHGTTVDRMIREADPSYADRMLVVRCGDLENPVPVNPFATREEPVFERAVSSFAELMGQIFDPTYSGIVGPRWERWFGLVSQGARAIMGERANLAAIQMLGASQPRLEQVAKIVEADHAELAKSIRTEFADRGSDRNEVLAWTGAKFQRLLGTPHLRAILETGADALNFDERIAAHDIVLIDLAMPTLGTPAARTVGTVVLEQLWAAALRRADRDHPYFVLVDEAHLFQHGALPAILAEGRKFGMGAVIATQHQRQLSQELLSGLTANAASLISFRTALQDARDVGARLGGYPTIDLTRLPVFQAAATLNFAGTPSAAFTLRVDHNDRVAHELPDPLLADRIVQRSRALLVDPFRELDPLTSEALDEMEEPRPVVTTDSSKFLDEWLAKRKARSPRPAGVQRPLPHPAPTTSTSAGAGGKMPASEETPDDMWDLEPEEGPFLND